MLNKKSQIKFGETFGIIIIVYIIIFTGLMWYNKINNKDLTDMRRNDLNQQAFEKYYYFSNLDLIHLSQKGIVEKEYDLNSLYTLANYSKTKNGKEFLRKQLKESIITLKIYNPEDLQENKVNITLTLYNNTPTIDPKKQSKIILEQIPFKTLIPVRNNDGKTMIGVLDVTVFIS